MRTNNIDDFLRDMIDDKPESNLPGWDKISPKVSVMNFFKFGVHHFNIYYTAAIIVALSGFVSVLAGINNQSVLKSSTKIMYSKNAINNNGSFASIQTLNKIEAVNSVEPESNPDLFRASFKNNEASDLVKIPSQDEGRDQVDSLQTNELHTATQANNLTEIESRLALLENTDQTEMAYSSDKPKVEEPKEQNSRIKKWSVEVFSQPVFTDAILLSSSKQFNNIGFANFENQKSKYAYGLNLSLHINNLILQTGVLYCSYNKSFDHTLNKTEVTKTTSYQTYTNVLYSLESGKELTSVTDSVLVTDQKTENKSFRYENLNSYRYLQIPLILGYKIRYHWFSAIAKTGVLLNLYQSAKGIAASADDVMKLESVNFNTNFSVTTSVGLYYKVNYRTHFMIEPYFKYNISIPSKSDFSILPNKTAIGLKLGFAFEI
jgi:hypothetical protein